MSYKREQFMAKLKKHQEEKKLWERYKESIGRAISPDKLSKSGLVVDKKNSSKFNYWFKPSRQPGEGCTWMEVDLCLQATIKSNILKEVKVIVHTTDNIGTGRTFVPERLEMDDAEHVSQIIESIMRRI